MRKIRHIWILVLLTTGCIDPYNPPVIQSDNSFLVIDGNFIPNHESLVQLSYTQNLAQDTAVRVIDNATVYVEYEDGTRLSFLNQGDGTYRLNPVDEDFSQDIRLVVETNGRTYQSDFVPVLQTPAIDSITYSIEDDGIQFYANTHDPQNNTAYYRWRYTDTWQLTSAYRSGFEFVDGEVRFRTNDIYNCWNSSNSSSIFIATTNNLTSDVVSQKALHKVSGRSLKLRIKYSLLVEQYALTRDGYEYFNNLKTNTENLGTLFDPIPFQLNGNIRNVADPLEPVIGYFYAATSSQERIFVSSGDHPYFIRNDLFFTCELDSVLLSDVAEESVSQLIVMEWVSEFGPNIIGYIMSPVRCVDCRIRGTNVEPDFWE